MSPTRRITALLLPAALLCTACVAARPGSASQAAYDELRGTDGWLLLDAVPFVSQENDEDCGAASLAMVLRHWGVDASAQALQTECRVAGLPGLRAIDLRDAARRRGFSAYLVAGEVADIERELRVGRPVITGLVKTFAADTFATQRIAHFEVVVGLRLPDEVAALDPARGLVRDSLAAFSAEWAETQRTTLVVFRPDPKPRSADVAGR